MIAHRYMAAILSAVTVLLSALISIPTGMLTGAAVVQMIALGASTVNTYISPLLNFKWKGILKTGGAVVAAIVAILFPIVHDGGFPTNTQIALMVLAAVNVVLTQVGVDIRVDMGNLLPADPTVHTASLDNTSVEALNRAADAAANAAAAADAVVQLQAPSMPLDAVSTAPTPVDSTTYAPPVAWESFLTGEPAAAQKPEYSMYEQDPATQSADQAWGQVAVNPANLGE